jgi:hypothetical protein
VNPTIRNPSSEVGIIARASVSFKLRVGTKIRIALASCTHFYAILKSKISIPFSPLATYT